MFENRAPIAIQNELRHSHAAWVAFLGTCLTLLLALPVKATELICEKTEAGWDLPQTTVWTQTDTQIYEKITNIGNNAAQIREELFVRTNSKPQTQNFTQMQKSMIDLRSQINSRLENVEGSGQLEFALIESYMQAARSVLLIDLTLQLSKENPYTRAQAYGLSLSLDTYKALFNSDYRYILGTTFIQKQNNYQLTFSNSTVLSLYLRALARSPEALKNPEAAMLKTLKCALSVTHIQKLLHHNALLNDQGGAISIPENSVICPTLKASDALSASEIELQGIREDMFRETGVKSIQTAYDGLDEKTSHAIVTQPTLAAVMPRMIMQPKQLAVALSTFGVDINSLDIDVQNLVEKIVAESESIYSDQNFKIIRSSFTPKMTELILPFAKSCGVKNDTEILNHQVLALLDGYYFPLNIQAHLSSLKLRMLNLDNKEKQKLIKNIIRWARKDSIYESYRQAFDYLRNPLSPEAVDLIFTAQTELDQLIDAELNRPEVQASLDELSEKILSTMTTEFAKSNVGVSLRKPLVVNAVQTAVKMAEYTSENTDPKSLPFVQAAIERAFEGRLSELTGVHKSYFSTVAQKADFFAQKETWGLVNTRLKNTASKLNTVCETPGFWGNAQKWVVGRISKQSEEARLFSVQCHILQTYAALVGLNESARPKILSDFWNTLQTIFTSDELEDFIKLYRKELEFEHYKVVPLLTAELQKKSLWQLLNAAGSDGQKDQLIESALRESHSILNSSLSQIQQANKLIDLATFFKRTKTLKVIFGGEQETQTYIQSLGLRDYQGEVLDDLSLDAGVMTQLRAEHDVIQQRFYRTERIQSEIFSDYVMNHLFIGWGFLGASVLKFGAHRAPIWVGGPALSRLVDVSLNRMRDLMIFQANTFSSILLYQIGIAQVEKSSFRTELQNVRQLYQSELSGMQGALSLISFQEFIRQRHYVDAMVAELTSLQKWNAAFILFPYVLDQALRKGHLMQAKFRDMRNLKLERLTANERAAIENKILKHATRQKRALAGDMRRLGVKDLYLSQLQAALERIRRNAKSTREIQLAEESYSRIIFEIGKETEVLLGKQHLLEVYRRGALGTDVSTQELYRFYKEYERVYAAWFKPAVSQ